MDQSVEAQAVDETGFGVGLAVAGWPSELPGFPWTAASLRNMRQVLSCVFDLSRGARSFAWARLASFRDPGLIFPLYEIIAQPLPWYLLSVRVTRPAASSSPVRTGDDLQVHACFGARAASSSTVSRTYRHAVVVPAPNPAASSANVPPLHRQVTTRSACRAGSGFRRRDPNVRR